MSSTFPTTSEALVWTIVAVAALGVVVRPFAWPEAVWAVTGAAVLVLSGLVSPADAATGVAAGTDVYLFLLGMMLLAEIARLEGLFDWLAAAAMTAARGSARRLFTLIFAVGVVVTTFLSNDATAVVLTPAVAAAVRAAKAPRPLPYLLVCAFVANAASFILPISNPANLVVYAGGMPALAEWLPRYLLPSVLALAATFAALRFMLRADLRLPLAAPPVAPRLGAGGRTAALGLAITAIGLVAASGMGVPLGLPTAVAGTLTTAVVLIRTRRGPSAVVRGISWGVVPLVAGLFVLVAALERTGLVAAVAAPLRGAGGPALGELTAAWAAGAAVAVLSNLANNLPTGLVAAAAVHAANPPDRVIRAILLGVNLGPNLSVTGSLATILWLSALRREGLHVGAATFFRLGAVVMPASLALALAAALLAP